MLTKTEYLHFLRCPRFLWLGKHRKETVHKPLDLGTEWMIQEGKHVEEIARLLFPKGYHVKSFHEAGARHTRECMEKGMQCLFQATALGEGLLAMADILQFDPKRGVWDIYEVKSSTQVKEEHLHDVCFQRIAFERAGYKIGKTAVIHVNKNYVRGEELDPSGLLAVEDVTDAAEEIRQEVLDAIVQAQEVLTLPNEPSLSEFPCGCSPKDSPCVEHCFPGLPAHSVFFLRGITSKKAQTFYGKGIRTVADIPEGTKLNKAQQLQVLSTKRGEPVISREAIGKFLSAFAYPLYFFDYETFSATVPLFPGFKPGLTMPFQYSLHVQRIPGGDFEHFEYLAAAFGNTIPDLIASLRAHIGGTGSVVVWNKGFEMGCNEEMAAMYPANAPFLQSVNERVVDLMEVFTKIHYMDARFDGSCSIKKVLPILVPTLSHQDLHIHEGMTASLSWYRMFDGAKTAEERERTREHLLEYCELDTLAMVEIFRFLLALGTAKDESATIMLTPKKEPKGLPLG